MDVAAIIVMTVVLLILAGVIIFLVRDYLSYKETTDDSLLNNKKGIEDEKTNRLSNLKYLVDRVNEINNSIYTEYQSTSNQTLSRFASLSNTQQRGMAGLNSFMQFKSEVNNNAASNISLLDLPGSIAPDVRLIKHVTMINGMTINEIGSNQNVDNVMFCSKGPNPRCIKFGDENGNTVLTSLKNGSRIVLDADSDIQGAFTFKSAGASPAQYGSISGAVSGTGTNMLISASNNMVFTPTGGKVGISTTPSFIPNAALHVESLSPVNDALRVSCANNKSVFVDKDGILNVDKLKIGNSTIEKDAQNNKLRITATDGIVVDTGSQTSQFTGTVVATVQPPV